MTSFIQPYNANRQHESPDSIKFYFVSKGEADIVKVVEYSFIQNFAGKRLFNPGFGDYDLAGDSIADDVNSNNGDMYKVFYTVLATITVFFEFNPESILMVQGSDHGGDFF